MTDEEKFLFIGELVKKHHHAFEYMNNENLKDYVELMAMFLQSKDDVILRGSFDTMDKIVRNTILDI